MSRAVFILLFYSLGMSLAYKIRRSDCRMDDSEVDSSVMFCTCGGIGDPYSIIMNKGPKPELGVPWYGTRYGHNIAEQVKQHMIDLNITRVTELHYNNCTGDYSALRIKIDFEDFAMDSYFKKNMTDLKLITFTNIHSVNLYLNSPLEWGNFTIKFNNILENNDFGYGKEGSVVVYGDVEYCYNPCDENSNSTNDNCNWCDPQSTLIMDFESLETVMFDDLILSPAVRKSQHGSSIVSMRNVSKLLVSGGRYDNVEFDIDVETCEAWGEPVNCSQVFIIGGVTLEEEGVPGLVIAALAVVFVFIAVVGVVVGMNGIKSGDY